MNMKKNLICNAAKLLSLALCLVTVIACFSACAAENGNIDAGAGFAVSVEDAPDTLTTDMEMSKVFELLGSMYDTGDPSEACPPFSGVHNLYDFVHVQITTYSENGTEYVMKIFAKDEGVSVSGVKLGSTLEEMETALGKDYKTTNAGACIYTAENGSKLTFILIENEVRSISVTTAKSDD